MRSNGIRQSFSTFFGDRGHTQVASSSLVPAGDPTLLFTNAGMVQFKQVFQGIEHRDYRRAVTAQKCVRAGGKHNDLEQVGLTARHHTFFEMLGNFSFGDYFKKGAIEYAWEWVTSEQYLGIDPDRIFISVHHTDHEARRLWRDVAGIGDEGIYGLGDKDNFWQMGDTGPCGPCSEMYVDLRGAQHAERGNTNRAPTLSEFEELAEGGDLFEIWNLVFMQFDQAADGSRSPLPAPSVDTGAGLERIAAVMQGVESDYDTDLFMPIIRRAEEVLGRAYDPGPKGLGFRVLADHARAVSFLLADGVYPSSDGRGYVLRRILRRAVRHAYLLGQSEPVLTHLAHVVVESLGESYPELREKQDHIETVTRAEEERFLETIDGGLARLDELTTGAPRTIPGSEAFKLYDTYGFPIDLTQLIAAERGWKVDQEGFEGALAEQQERSRTAGKREKGKGKGDGSRSKPEGGFTRVIPRKRQRFVGYETTRAETDILAFRKGDDRLELILRDNPFYAESGGQVSDTGVIRGEGWTLPVEDVVRLEGKQVVVGPYEGPFEPTPVEAVVADERRRNIERNHSATHLVHAALRKVLGVHVRQAGSVVAPDRLRFDFSHHAPVRPEELDAIEEEVNEHIWENVGVETRQMPYKEAIARGAIAFFGDKYGDVVRLVDMPGVSMELCGGTHVRSTGQIGLFHFAGETGVAAGVRRIEAITGPVAYTHVKSLGERIDEAAGTLRTNPEHLARKIESLLDEKKRLERQVEELLREGGSGKREAYERHTIGEVELLVGDSPVSDRGQIGLLMDSFREQHKNAIQVLFAGGERAGIHVGVTDDLISRGIKAGDIVSRIAAVSGGRGGGRPHFASAGVGDPSKLGSARAATRQIVSDLLAARPS
ncbi:MAG: alanine--tRNA ligase [Gemmatimonadota bacterium]|nr:alanine--tRNA ligase [Gemmatimonadota bacterium]